MDIEKFEKIAKAKLQLEELQRLVENSKKNNFVLHVNEPSYFCKLEVPGFAKKYINDAIEQAYKDFRKQFEEM